MYFNKFTMNDAINEIYNHLFATSGDINTISDYGRTVADYVYAQNVNKMKNATRFMFKNKSTIACFDVKGSKSFDSIEPNAYDLLMAISPIYEGLSIKKYSISIYSVTGTDCSLIAKEMGGGGHVSAAGFIVNDLSELGVINEVKSN